MPLFLIHRTDERDRNESGIHAALADAATEQDARDLAAANAPNGGTRIPSTWAAVQIAASGTLPVNPLFLSGDVHPLVPRRGQ